MGGGIGGGYTDTDSNASGAVDQYQSGTSTGSGKSDSSLTSNVDSDQKNTVTGKNKYQNQDTFGKSNSFQDSLSKEKKVKFNVEGGTDLEFTNYSAFKFCLSDWLNLVIFGDFRNNFRPKY